MVPIQNTLWSCRKESLTMGATPIFHMFRLVENTLNRKLFGPYRNRIATLPTWTNNCQTSSRATPCQISTFLCLCQETFQIYQEMVPLSQKKLHFLSFLKMRNLLPLQSCHISLSLLCSWSSGLQFFPLKKCYMMIKEGRRSLSPFSTGGLSVFCKFQVA